jgi:hypothetical protein
MAAPPAVVPAGIETEARRLSGGSPFVRYTHATPHREIPRESATAVVKIDPPWALSDVRHPLARHTRPAVLVETERIHHGASPLRARELPHPGECC